MTIDELYKYIKFLANKENRGWLKPSEFNLMAKRAQLDVLKDRFGKISPDGTNDGYRENAQFYDEIRTVIQYNTSLAGTGTYAFPSNYLYFLALRFNDAEVEIIDHGELTKRRKSHLMPPSPDNPVGLIESGGIRIYTSSASAQSGDARLTYVKEPSAPNWRFTVVNGIEVYQSTDSVHLTLPESTHKEIAQRILAYLGVLIREANMIEYSTSTILEQNS
tara:strand:- start:1496 stop:2155 length:660 start_codon:yes stop_codon:yes gene_type:complete